MGSLYRSKPELIFARPEAISRQTSSRHRSIRVAVVAESLAKSVVV
jgi:hypothetical protein